MNIPKAFVHDLHAARLGNTEWHFGCIFRDHEPFLRRMCKFALRCNLWGMISDEDDLFQEACFRLIRYVRQWDESREVPLERYVVYNIGADLAKIPNRETNRKRRADAPPMPLTQNVDKQSSAILQYDIHTTTGHERVRYQLHTNYIVNRDEERAVAIHRAVQNLNKRPLIYQLLLNALVEEGTILGAAKRIKSRVRTNLDDRTFAKEEIQKKYLPKLQEYLREELSNEGVEI